MDVGVSVAVELVGRLTTVVGAATGSADESSEVSVTQAITHTKTTTPTSAKDMAPLRLVRRPSVASSGVTLTHQQTLTAR